MYLLVITTPTNLRNYQRKLFKCLILVRCKENNLKIKIKETDL